jgi:hypothetical protein
MPEREAVEKFKLTPEMKGFLKTYKAYKGISDRLRGKMQIQLDEVSQTRGMLEQVEKGMQLLTLNSPQKPTFEIEGQEPAASAPQQQGMEQQASFDPSMNY